MKIMDRRYHLSIIYFVKLLLLLTIFNGCADRLSQVPKPEKTKAIVDDNQHPNPDALKHFMDAQLYLSQNNYPMAIIELQDALNLDPGAGSIHVSLAEAFWKLGKIDRAEEHLNVALTIDEKDLEAREILANQFITRHNYEEADIQFSLLQKYDPENAEYIISQAQLAAARMQWQRAISLYLKAYETDKSRIDVLEKAAEIALRSQQLHIAREIYETLVKIDSSNINYLSAFTDLLLIEERYDEAEDFIKKIIHAEGKNKDRLFQSGVIFYQKKRFTQALSFFKEALMLNEEDEHILHFISTVYLELGKPDSGVVYSERLIALYPDNVRGYLDRSMIALNMKQFNIAVDILLPVADKFADDFAVQFILGNAYNQQKLYEDALIYLNRSLGISPNSRNVLHILAIINDSIQRWTKSDSLYEQLISTDSTDAQAYNNYAYSLVERNERLDFARQNSKKAILLAPKNAAYLDTYGWILFKLGEANQALDYIQDSIDLEETNAVVLEHLGDVLAQVNRHDDALKIYRKAYKINPDNDTLRTKAFPK